MNIYIRLWILGLGYPPPTALTGRGPDPHHLIVGSDPTYHYKADWVRILLLIKVMRAGSRFSFSLYCGSRSATLLTSEQLVPWIITQVQGSRGLRFRNIQSWSKLSTSRFTVRFYGREGILHNIAKECSSSYGVVCICLDFFGSKIKW